MSGDNKVGPVSPQEAVLSDYLEGLLATRLETFEDLREAAECADVQIEPSPEQKPSAPRSPAEDEGQICVLKFQLGRLQFAVAADQIREIRVLEEDQLISREGSAGLLGIVDLAGQAVSVIDTAAMVLPGKGANRPYAWLLLLTSGTAALACQAVERESVVSRDQVRWREERGSRPWLLGMMDDTPCPLIDAEVLVEALAGDRSIS